MIKIKLSLLLSLKVTKKKKERVDISLLISAGMMKLSNIRTEHQTRSLSYCSTKAAMSQISST